MANHKFPNFCLLLLILITTSVTASMFHRHPHPRGYRRPFHGYPNPLAGDEDPCWNSSFRKQAEEVFLFVAHCGPHLARFLPHYHTKPGGKCCEHAHKVNFKFLIVAFFIPETEELFNPKKVRDIAIDCGVALDLLPNWGDHQNDNYTSVA